MSLLHMPEIFVFFIFIIIKKNTFLLKIFFGFFGHTETKKNLTKNVFFKLLWTWKVQKSLVWSKKVKNPCLPLSPALFKTWQELTRLSSNNKRGVWLRRQKSLPAIQEPRVRSQGREDPLAEGMATHSSILAQRTPWTDHGAAKRWTQLSN